MTTVTEPILQNKIVDVRAIVRKGKSWLPEGHDGEFQFTGAKNGYCVPLESKNTYYKILTDEEQAYLEDKMSKPQGYLTHFRGHNNFWSSEMVFDFGKEGTSLDLSKPIDYIKYKVLKASKSIAPSFQERFDSPHYRFYLQDRDEQVKNNASKINKKKLAYSALAKMDVDVTALQNVLFLYGKETDSKNLDFLNTEIEKIIEKDIDTFLKLVSDPDRELKILINTAVKHKALKKPSRTTFTLPEGDLIGNSLAEAVAWFKDPLNSEAVATIKARIEVGND
jgi:hypothetical protein